MKFTKIYLLQVSLNQIDLFFDKIIRNQEKKLVKITGKNVLFCISDVPSVEPGKLLASL